MIFAFIWFLLGLSLFVLEALFPGLVLFFFGFGAWLTALVSWWFSISLTWQLLLFLSSSLILLFFLRHYLKSIFYGRMVINKDSDEENFDGYIGETAVVKVALTPTQKGRVEFHGTLWIAQANEILEEGAQVKIIGRNNLTLEVTALT